MSGGFVQYKHRLLFSLLRAAARVGLRFRMPLHQMELLLQMAYFEQARERQGLTLDAISDLFGKSLRTVSTLQRTFKSDFFSPERDVALRRDVAAEIGRGARSLPMLVERIPSVTRTEVYAAVEDLVREGRVLRIGDGLRRNPEEFSFFDELNVMARIDGLNRQMDIVADTVWMRLVNEAPDGEIARSFVFAAEPEEFRRLAEDLVNIARERALAADDRGQASATARRYGVTVAATRIVEDDPPDRTRSTE
jgi:hypothetical protein